MADEVEEVKEVYINKARYWWAVLYPENMREDWREAIDDLVQVPYAYCVHDLDHDSKSEHRKEHVHLILVFPNTTTRKHAMTVFSLLNAEGKKAFNTCQAIINIRHAYDYLIHDTPTCEKQGKELYSKDCRVEGNGFDIGLYEQVSEAEKLRMLQELADFIIDEGFVEFASFYMAACEKFDASYFQIIAHRSTFLEKLTKGNYQRYDKRLKERELEITKFTENLNKKVETIVKEILNPRKSVLDSQPFGHYDQKAVTEDGRQNEDN